MIGDELVITLRIDMMIEMKDIKDNDHADSDIMFQVDENEML